MERVDGEGVGEGGGGMNEREKKELLEWYGRYAGVTVRSNMEEEFVYDAYRVLLKHDPDTTAPLERVGVQERTSPGLLYFLGLPQGDVLRYYGGVSEEEMRVALARETSNDGS